jgi:hypothetical protein
VSRLVVLTGIAAGVGGSFVLWGLGVALLVIAPALVLYGLLLIDVKG